MKKTLPEEATIEELPEEVILFLKLFCTYNNLVCTYTN